MRGRPAVLEVAGGVARAALGALAGLLQLPLLPLEFLLGVADVLLGDLLLGADGLLVLREVPAVQAQFVAAEFGDAFHTVEQRAVVADQKQTAVEVRQDVVQLVPGLQVEVVGGLVEQEHVGALEQLGGEAERDDLAAAERAEAAVQCEVGEAQTVELGAGALLDVPVVADDGEVLLADVPGLHGVQGADHLGDTEHLGDREVPGQGKALREVAEGAPGGHRAGGGLQFTGDQLEQSALAGAVGGDQAGTAGGTLKDRSWKTGVSSGQEKERFEQTMAASDMEVTSEVLRAEHGSLPWADMGKGYDKTDHGGSARARGPVAVRSGSHPEMSSSPTMSATPR